MVIVTDKLSRIFSVSLTHYVLGSQDFKVITDTLEDHMDFSPNNWHIKYQGHIKLICLCIIDTLRTGGAHGFTSESLTH